MGTRFLFTFHCPLVIVPNTVRFKTEVGGSNFVTHVKYCYFVNPFIFHTLVEILRYAGGQLRGVQNSVLKSIQSIIFNMEQLFSPHNVVKESTINTTKHHIPPHAQLNPNFQ
jgi:hypothetical protein